MAEEQGQEKENTCVVLGAESPKYFYNNKVFLVDGTVENPEAPIGIDGDVIIWALVGLCDVFDSIVYDNMEHYRCGVQLLVYKLNSDTWYITDTSEEDHCPLNKVQFVSKEEGIRMHLDMIEAVLYQAAGQK